MWVQAAIPTTVVPTAAVPTKSEWTVEKVHRLC